MLNGALARTRDADHEQASRRSNLGRQVTAKYRLAHLGVLLTALSLVASACGGNENASSSDTGTEAIEEVEDDSESITTDEIADEDTGTDTGGTPESPDANPDEDPDAASAPEEEPPEVCPPESDSSWGTSSRASADWPAGPGGPTVLANTAIGAHDGYDRFVLTFDEQTGPLSWAVQVVNGQPVHFASGLEFDIEGSEFLHVVFAGVAAWMLDPEDQYAGPNELDGVDAGTSNLVQAVLSGEFEAQVAWHIGYDQINAFRVFTLDSPSRLVIDMCVDGDTAG